MSIEVEGLQENNMAKRSSRLEEITRRIVDRSRKLRSAYLAQMMAAQEQGPYRGALPCGNLAHASAAAPTEAKEQLTQSDAPNIAIVTSYNDMLSAHQPLGDFPPVIKQALLQVKATGQIAGAVPAMCDGVTQGQAGMDISLFSRDVIAQATAIALSHNVFDGALLLGVCDKIVPGLFIGAARFGHLPIIFMPAGPMPSGLANEEKARIRRLYAEGRLDRDALLKAEMASYHAPGTCTFYGTANSNQMLMEIMGLHMPGTAFVPPGSDLRKALIEEAAKRMASITHLGQKPIPFYQVMDEQALVNGIVGLHATGGSTNLAIHLIAMARSVGIIIDWDDFSDLSEIIPLLCRIYPNGFADVNQFHAVGGIGFVIRELLDAGLLHEDVWTVNGKGLRPYTLEPHLEKNQLARKAVPKLSANRDILADIAHPAAKTGGLKLLKGNLGRAILKTSALKKTRHVIEAPVEIFNSQSAFIEAFEKGQLEKDFIAVLAWQGPKANGMPELHKLTPLLSVLQNKGFKVALVTDGRMSGASGAVPAAIHLTPEAYEGGAIGKLRKGDRLRLDAKAGTLDVLIDATMLDEREGVTPKLTAEHWGMGRELFAGMRDLVTGAEQGAMTFQLQEQSCLEGEQQGGDGDG
jgi:phosphogluconate dehydratase